MSVEIASLFPAPPPCPVPQWLRELLECGMRQVLLSEEARSELIIVPVLHARQELSPRPISIHQ